MVTRINAQEAADVLSLYEQGATLDALGKTYRVSPVTIRNTILRLGGTLRRTGGPTKDFTEDQVYTIFRRWEAGEPLDKIARELKCNRGTLMNLLKRYGYEYETRHPLAGEGHHPWKGGRIQAGDYMAVRPALDDTIGVRMINSVGYVPEHRLVMAHYLGRPLLPTETVHHIDGDKMNNELSNLQLRIGGHGKGQAYCCSECGSTKIRPIALN